MWRKSSDVDSSVRKIIHKSEILSITISSVWNRVVSSYGQKQQMAGIKKQRGIYVSVGLQCSSFSTWSYI